MDQTHSFNSVSHLKDRVILESRRGSYSFYYERFKGDVRKYLGSENSELVQDIKNAHFLDRSLKTLNSNIKLLKKTIETYKPYDYESISESLPKAYRSKKRIDDSPMHYNSTELKWLEEMQQLKKEINERYPEKYQNSFRIQRANGEWMRSKSEGMIADLLDSYKIPYVYELPHYCNNTWIRTDFTMLSKRDSKTVILLEHLGLMDNESYRNNLGTKISSYMSAGYRPNINLFFTFDNIDQSYSLIPLQNIIDNWLL